MEKGLLNSFVYGYFTYLGGPNSGVFQRAMVIVKSLYELDDPSLIPRGMDLFMQMMAVNFLAGEGLSSEFYHTWDRLG